MPTTAQGADVSIVDGELVIRVRLDATPADELVPVAAAPLAAFGLELRAVQRLIAEGKLRAVEVGRRRFTKLSYLLALVDELDVAAPVAKEPEPAGADALELAARKAARRASARKRATGERGAA